MPKLYNGRILIKIKCKRQSDRLVWLVYKHCGKSTKRICAHLPVFLTPHLNILIVGNVDFKKKVHDVHKFVRNSLT